ncbi:MAG: hypothetical protein O8C66_03275 [Candidatus Methanoperedens sp.]|nr:hypothetical protein [Candidatus Methanoperedens sp.]MCZ7369508.1 hypothetical protein [Candidatus Methanoperedens sp.]
MEKKSPFFTASAASVVFFIIFIALKYLVSVEKILDWKGALEGAVIFWIVIFLVHQFFLRRTAD